MAKKITGYIKIVIPAGEAKPSPPVGPALGQKGLNIMEFCKAFNAKTQSIEAKTPIPVVITAYEDKTFSFIMKTPPVSFLLKRCAGISKGSSSVKKEAAVGKVKMSDCVAIAKQKLEDLNTLDIMAAARTVKASAESMGIEVLEDL